jgi:hypothetical protein
MDGLIAIAGLQAPPPAPPLSLDLVWALVGAARPTMLAALVAAGLLAIPRAWPRAFYASVAAVAAVAIIGSIVWIVEAGGVSFESIDWTSLRASTAYDGVVADSMADPFEGWRRLTDSIRMLAVPFLLGSAASGWLALRGWRRCSTEATRELAA